MKYKSSRLPMPQIQRALFYLLRCRDELQEVEAILGMEIEFDYLGQLADGCRRAEDANNLTIRQVTEWMDMDLLATVEGEGEALTTMNESIEEEAK